MPPNRATSASNVRCVASAEVRNVDLRKVPMQIVGFDAPLTAGRVNAAVRAGGTLHHPTLHADVRAVDLCRTGAIDHLDLDGSLEWENGRVQLSGRAALRGAPLFSFEGDKVRDLWVLGDIHQLIARLEGRT